MSTFLVTGGAGFIGSNFVRLLAAERPESTIIVFDKLTYAGNRDNVADLLASGRVQLVTADIADRAAVDRAYGEYRPRFVVNFAAESHVDRSIDGPRAFVLTNVVGAFEMLDGARAYHATLGTDDAAAFRFLHVSTDEVYGSLGTSGLFSEETPYAPNSPYSATKAGADHLVRAYQHTFGLPVLLTNCSNNYGPYQFPEKLIPLMILNALEGRPLPIYGDGGNVRDWLHVEDHCRGLLTVLETGVPGEKYNLGGRSERTNLEIVDFLCNAIERHQPAARNPALAGRRSYRELRTFVPDRPGHDRRYAIDDSKIERELGWRPRHTLETGLAETVAWYLAHRDWCTAVAERGFRRQRLGTGASA